MCLQHSASITCCWIFAAALLSGKNETRGAPQSSRTATCSASSPKTSKRKPTKFKYGRGRGEVDTEYGIRLGFTDFTASDGVGLRVFYLAEDDQVRAKTAFNEEVARALKVFEVGEKKDPTGRVVGQRARILARSSKPHPPFSAVIWTDGATFHEIASSSMQYDLELEKVYKY